MGQTEQEIKTTCPGPLTLTIHMQTRPGDAYDGDRMALAYDCAGAINRELHALADAGARWIQLDEPSYSIIPGQAADWIALYNTAVQGIAAAGGASGPARLLRQPLQPPPGAPPLRLDVPRPPGGGGGRDRPGVRQPGDDRDRAAGPRSCDAGKRRRRRGGGRQVLLRGAARGGRRAGAGVPAPRPPGAPHLVPGLRLLPAPPLAVRPEAAQLAAGGAVVRREVEG